jgi:hypothetical protein
MENLRELHHRAMEMADEAFFARRRGDREQPVHFARQAFLLEKEVADLMVPLTDIEPPRSVLHRSAATLAVDCGEIEEAKYLVARGLEGKPPADIGDELLELRARIEEIEAQTATKATATVA